MTNYKDRVMVDLETLGLEKDAAILSIGAVHFDKSVIGERFYESVSLKSCQEAGLFIDAETLDWWLSQDESVQDVLTGGKRLGNVLEEFARFIDGADEIWAYSPSFDCAILYNAYEETGQTPPWTYKEERDARTIAKLDVERTVEHEGEEHNALDDAVYQARVVAEALCKIEDSGEKKLKEGQ